MAKIVKKSPAPLYLAAAVWAAWAVLAPLYAWWHFALAWKERSLGVIKSSCRRD